MIQKLLIGLVVLFLVGCTPAEGPVDLRDSANVEIIDFETCVAMGNPVTASYPAQCEYDGVTYIEEVLVTNFGSCLAAGNPVMESYPAQCQHGGITYIQNVLFDDIEVLQPIDDLGPEGVGVDVGIIFTFVNERSDNKNVIAKLDGNIIFDEELVFGKSKEKIILTYLGTYPLELETESIKNNFIISTHNGYYVQITLWDDKFTLNQFAEEPVRYD